MWGESSWESGEWAALHDDAPLWGDGAWSNSAWGETIATTNTLVTWGDAEWGNIAWQTN